MGLIPPEQVPDTFLLKDVVGVGNGKYRATKVPLRISDIVAVEGPRIPSSTTSQKVLRLGVYLLYDPAGVPNLEMKARAEGYVKALIHYFDIATGSVMKVIQ